MLVRQLGNTGLEVSAVGLGAGRIGDAALSEAEVERLLHGAVDAGITFIDTAPSYGASEERIGRHLGSRRARLVLSTKGGYGVPGVADWTGEVVTRGVEQALLRLRTDYVDVFHLHSCDRDTLVRDDILRALERVRDAGKVRVVAYSGESDALSRAIDLAIFGSVQCSVNVCDQASLSAILPRARARNMGIVAKRALANCAWRFAERPVGDYAEAYWDRLQRMRLDLGADPLDVAARFSAFAPGVSAILVGTASLDHLARNLASVARGPLPSDVSRAIEAAFDPSWPGLV